MTVGEVAHASPQDPSNLLSYKGGRETHHQPTKPKDKPMRTVDKNMIMAGIFGTTMVAPTPLIFVGVIGTFLSPLVSALYLTEGKKMSDKLAHSAAAGGLTFMMLFFGLVAGQTIHGGEAYDAFLAEADQSVVEQVIEK